MEVVETPVVDSFKIRLGHLVKTMLCPERLDQGMLEILYNLIFHDSVMPAAKCLLRAICDWQNWVLSAVPCPLDHMDGRNQLTDPSRLLSQICRMEF